METLRPVMQGVAVRLVISRAYSLSMCLSLRDGITDPLVVRAAPFTDTDEPVE
ncbi:MULTISPECIES: hypothetical protein [unclassified Streptomyces]|uniref:hypothetical protein n=1 Tax=unclassified Streptomyces TaxID=2593676 RepID=UPI003249FAE4